MWPSAFLSVHRQRCFLAPPVAVRHLRGAIESVIRDVAMLLRSRVVGVLIGVGVVLDARRVADQIIPEGELREGGLRRARVDTR